MAPYARPNVIYETFPDRFRVPDRKYSSFYAEKILFTQEELVLIQSYFRDESHRVYPITEDNLQINPNGSSFTEHTFTWNEETNFVFQRVQDWTKELELDFKWIKPPWTEFRRYKKGDYFVKHDDTPWDHDGLPKRYFTIGIQLNDGYQGGDFVIDDLHTMEKKAGNVTLWGIEVPHEVTLITSGIRETLVMFVDVESGQVGEKKLM